MDGPPAKLLVVDDNEMNRDMLSRRLARRGFEVETAVDGSAALEMLDAAPFDLVLLDIMMPGIDGFEVLETVRRKKDPGELPIIMATAKSDTQDVVKALGMGANDYVTKPLDFPIVLARVNTQLSLKQARDELQAAHGRMKSDLQAAARMQHDLLPARATRVGGTTFTWCYEPCDELAGDLLNVIPLDEHHAAVYVLDICGHGVRSALLSVAMTHTLSHKRDPSSIITVPGQDGKGFTLADPAQVAARLSALFPMEANDNLFAALVFGIADTRTGEFRFTCAGHPGPVILRENGEVEEHDIVGLPIGFWLGDAPDPGSYQVATVHLEPGDRLYLCSDGVTEEPDASGELFGAEQLARVLRAARSGEIAASLDDVLGAVQAWSSGAGLRDDVSIVSWEHTADRPEPRESDPAARGRQLTVGARPESLPVVREFVAGACQDSGMDQATTCDVQLAVEEACANIIEHGYVGRPDGEIALEIVGRSDSSLGVTISDTGQAHEPLDLDRPSLEDTLSGARGVGGFGVYFMHQLMDEVSYASDARGNHLTLTKAVTGGKEE